MMILLRRTRRAAILVALIPSLTHAQDSAGKKPLTPAAAIALRTIEDLQLSPDGAQLAFVVGEAPKGSGRVRHVWILDMKSGDARQFTASAKSETSPRWSPDGKTLAFLSDRDEKKQIYLMRMDGGEAKAFTKGKRSVTALSWSPDGKTIAFLAPDTASDAENKKEKDKNDAQVVDKDDRHARLWVQAIAGGDARPLTQTASEVNELVWGAPGDRIIVSITDTPASDENTNRIAAVHVTDGRVDSLFAPRGPFGDLLLSPSGKTFGFVGARDGGPVNPDLYVMATSGGAAPKSITAKSLDRPVYQYRFTSEDAGLLVAEDGFRNSLASWSAQGATRDAAQWSMSPVNFVIAPSGGLAFTCVSPTLPPEICLWDRKSAPRRVTHVNDAWIAYALVTPRYFKYKSFDGREIEGALMTPANYDGKTRLPLVTLVHGGPTGRWTASVEPWGQLLVAHGYAVFYANIRGSSGYGEEFLESNRADWGGADYRDLMIGIDTVIARGIADSTRLGIAGWSYGGYMAEWAITQTTRFKAAVSGAGMANLLSEFGTEAGPAYDEWFWGAPYEKPDGFMAHSPVKYLKNAKTPTLILQGEADATDPLGQSQELYRGLKHYGVAAELVVYPREPHGLQEEMHLIDRLDRIIAWFDKYLSVRAAAR